MISDLDPTLTRSEHVFDVLRCLVADLAVSDEEAAGCRARQLLYGRCGGAGLAPE